MAIFRVGYYRWVICALLFFAATINYIDRQVIGILKPTLVKEFRLDGRTDLRGDRVFSFQLAYAIGLLLAGRVIDRIGTAARLRDRGRAVEHRGRRPMRRADWFPWLQLPTLNLDATTGVSDRVCSPAPPRVLRWRGFALGIGEAGNFPASIKTVAEWFPKKERALATGIFNSGTNVGALVTPLLVPWIALHWGWQWAFIITGVTGFLWLVLWLWVYRTPEEHPRLSAAELAYIRSDPPEPPSTDSAGASLFPHRQTWAFAIGKFLTDPIWWVYLFWIPDFLNSNHGLDLKIDRPAAGRDLYHGRCRQHRRRLDFLGAASNAAGASTRRARRRCSSARWRSCRSFSPPRRSNLWVAVGSGLARAAAHQGWSANIFTLASDMFPRQAVGSVVGIGGMAGAIGGMFIALIVGEILQRTGSYVPIFIIAGSAYLVALTIIHLLAPRLEPAKI